MSVAIETHGLTKAFAASPGWRRAARPATIAVDGVTLAVERGEVFGLLGPNGAGKTTLTKILCTLILPDAGTARVAGHDLREAGAIRSAVGLVVTDERSFYWRLSGRRNLRFFAALHGLFGAVAEARVDEVLEAVEMRPHADSRFSNYSTGMKQRLAIARALLHRPRLLFLDEPSRSLDPAATRRLHHLIRNLAADQAATIFLITHDLSEAEALCARVAVMHHGRIRALGSPETLRRALQPTLRYTVRLAALPDDDWAAVRSVLPGVERVDAAVGVDLLFGANEDDGLLERLLALVAARQLTIRSIEGQPPTLEEVFAHHTTDPVLPGHGR